MTHAALQRAPEQAMSLMRTGVRLGFVGAGSVGRSHLQALANSGLVAAVAVIDPDPASVEACEKVVPEACVCESFRDLLMENLDGVVIATPSSLHAEQSVDALSRGLAVFCRKPLGRSMMEAKRVVEAARRADRLLGVDLPYRWTRAGSALREVVRSGRIGRVFHADLMFHRTRGPAKPWFYDMRLAGGGCVMELGAHLIDLALWTLDFPDVVEISGRLCNKGVPLRRNSAAVEDFATVQLLTADNVAVAVQCSWSLHADRETVILARFCGERGTAVLENTDGGLPGFRLRLYSGTTVQTLVEPPDHWPGRAAVEWARQLACRHRFDPAAKEHLIVAEVLDRIYGRGT